MVGSSQQVRKGGLFNSVNRRIIAIIGLVTTTFLIGAHFWSVGEIESAKELKVQIAAERKDVVNRIVQAESAQLDKIVKDYSTWTELCEFVNKPSEPWASSNLDSTFASFDLSFVIVCDSKGNVVYQSGVDKASSKIGRKFEFDFNRAFADEILVDSGFDRVNGELVQYSMSPIVRSDDLKKTGVRSGLLIFGKVWNSTTVKSLADRSGSKIRILSFDGILDTASITADKSDDGGNIFNFVQLKNQAETPVATVRFMTPSPTVAQVNQSVERAMQFALAFSVILLSLLSAILQFWIVRPLSYARKSLESDAPVDLNRLEKDPTEFGQIGALIRKFHEQREEIRAANQELEAANEELASVNEYLEARVQQRTKELADAYEATIEGWSRAMEVRDQETQGHCERVTAMSMHLGRAMGLSNADMVRLKRGALLHDIGKMGIPDGILLKPGRLTPEERVVIEKHPVIAYEMLRPIKFLSDCLDVPLFHHEKWDGTGYPYKLEGPKIPLNARIFAVADVWDAMRSDRPYREAWDEQRTRDFIIENSGSHFDPQVVEAYLSLQPEMLDEMRARSLKKKAPITEQKAA